MAEATLDIAAVNALDEAAFVSTFGATFEDTPDLAAAAYAGHPFADRDALVAAFVAAADALHEDEALELLRAHPQLASAAPMGATSAAEQRAAGLAGDGADRDVLDRIRSGNARYVERFGFPFIIAVRGLGPADIAEAIEARLANTDDEEIATALAQVKRIAALRIEAMVAR